jgi:predicted RNA-binding protein with TRAM domain
LQELAFFGWVVVLEVRLDGFVLFVKEGEVGDEVLDDVH